MQLDGVSDTMIPLIDTDTLHSILWELFNIAVPDTFDNDPFETWADMLWYNATKGKESLWATNPDSVLSNIIETYTELM